MPDDISDERIAEIKKHLEYPHLRSKIAGPSFSEKLAILARMERAEAVVARLTCKVNGYNQRKMLEDIKPVVIAHGGYQNAYTISHVIETIEAALAAKSGGAGK